ncbi:MAG TPA: ABC transporter substrate-binding protein [Candidatus Binatia bacterium]|nr:ABC transporter substrate-binding protein [Candidatus Binatia bacterium]
MYGLSPAGSAWRRGAVRSIGVVLGLCLSCAPRSSDDRRTLHFVTWKADQPAVWDEALRRFGVEHPEIRVERQIGPHSSTAFHDLVTQKLKNRDPGIDVYFLDVVWLAEFAAAGWVAPLDSRFRSEDRAEFLEGPIEASTWRGQVYAVPAFIDAGILYYRRDLLEKYRLPVPTTWAELEAEARQIVAAERSAEPELRGYSGQFQQYEGLVCNMLEFVTANGGRFLDERGLHASLQNHATLEAIRWVRDHVIGGLAPRSVLTYQEPESLALFLQGLAVFHRNWPYAWNVANDPAQSRVAGNVGVAPLPHFAGGQSRSALGGWLYGISRFSRRADAAWTFIEFMTSHEMQKYFAMNASLGPTRAPLYEDPGVLGRNPQFAGQRDAFRLAVPRPLTPMYPAVSGALQRFLSAAISIPDEDLAPRARAAEAEIDRYLELAG